LYFCLLIEIDGEAARTWDAQIGESISGQTWFGTIVFHCWMLSPFRFVSAVMMSWYRRVVYFYVYFMCVIVNNTQSTIVIIQVWTHRVIESSEHQSVCNISKSFTADRSRHLVTQWTNKIFQHITTQQLLQLYICINDYYWRKQCQAHETSMPIWKNF